MRTISGQVDLLRRKEQDLVRQIEDVSGEGLLGPCQKSLEPVLQAVKIQPQIYHGGAFISNHVHAAMKPTVVDALTQASVTVEREVPKPSARGIYHRRTLQAADIWICCMQRYFQQEFFCQSRATYIYYYYSTMALANKDDPASNGVIYCYEVSVDLGALNRSRWRRE